MKMYLAGLTFLPQVTLSIHGGGFDSELVSRVNMLESFYYIQPWQTALIPKLKSFLLDSGAFSFAYSGSRKQVNLSEYMVSYTDFINENDINDFFEMDIDPMIGYEKVKELRNQLERETNRKCIPVWHLNRGKKDWEETCEKYDRVAIGGLATKQRKQLEPHIRSLTKIADKYGARVHGLGYTNLENLKNTGFDSVDSTAWLHGNRGGFLYSWDGRTMHKRKSASNQRLKARDSARHNFIQWVEMSERMEEIGV